jgi:hypothetical protein
MNLRLMIKKGRAVAPPYYPADAARATYELVTDHRTILVKCQSVSNDVLNDKILPREALAELQSLAHPVPPYTVMWLEFRGPDGVLNGALVVRATPEWFQENMLAGDGAKVNIREIQFAVSCFFFTEKDGYVLGPFNEICYCIGKETGDVHGQVLMRKPKGDPSKGDWFALCLLVVGHAMARMNCRNVVLRPVASPRVSRRHQRDLVPATVWHEIHITNVPQLRSSGQGVLGREESMMRRFWVRGHYADYRHGAGLFGNPKLRCVFWIPEHQRGNPELGDVIPEYAIA